MNKSIKQLSTTDRLEHTHIHLARHSRSHLKSEKVQGKINPWTTFLNMAHLTEGNEQ